MYVAYGSHLFQIQIVQSIEIGPITFICIGRIRQISQNKSVACYQLDKLTWVYTDELKGRLEAGGSDFQVKRFRWQQLPNFVPYK